MSDGYVYEVRWVEVVVDGNDEYVTRYGKNELSLTDEQSARQFAGGLAAREGYRRVQMRRRPEPAEWEDVPL